MHDEATSKSDAASAEAEEALSRAAREAVRQPADPRLEKSFARLGLFTDEETPAAPPRPGEPVPDPGRGPAPAPAPARPAPVVPTVGSISPAVDLDPLRADVSALQAAVSAVQASADRLESRLGTVTWLAMALLVAVGLLAVVVLVRG
jgi:hypothetical protein